jgi:hypothetical protein
MQKTPANPVVRKTVVVNAEPEHAFAIFTRNMGQFVPDIAQASEVEVRFISEHPAKRKLNRNTVISSGMAKAVIGCAPKSINRVAGRTSWRDI